MKNSLTFLMITAGCTSCAGTLAPSTLVGEWSCVGDSVVNGSDVYEDTTVTARVEAINADETQFDVDLTGSCESPVTGTGDPTDLLELAGPCSWGSLNWTLEGDFAVDGDEAFLTLVKRGSTGSIYNGTCTR